MSKKSKPLVFHILTLFPESFRSPFASSITKRAQEKKIITINILNIRDFANNRHKTVDDKPYGGGRGMILKVDITTKALQSIKPKPYSILLSASGKKYNQKKAYLYSKKKNLALICGHYEGIDARVEHFADEVVTIGDFVLSGGEIAAMAIVDSVTRLLPDAIKRESLTSESFLTSTEKSSKGQQPGTILEYPQYTRPKIFRNLKVPEILLSGNHKKIEKWRKVQALKRTQKFRPDLLKN